MCANHNIMPTPPLHNLPKGTLDWAEISVFIEDMLNPHRPGKKGWQLIKDADATKELQPSSVLVLHILFDDLYGFFYKQHGERAAVWSEMEDYLRNKYAGLSETSLSRILATYHMDDR